jgi:lysophospholipase L1-like esterase
VKPFDASTYQKMLAESVRNMKTVFPAAACILVAPGDRGILVPRSINIRNIRKNPGAVRRELQKMTTKMRLVLASLGKRNRKIQPASPIDLLQYSKIHARIGRIQAQVAADAGCSAWSMQDAMGGPGHSYEWAHRSPALMSGDLIHFTVAGYQRLAQGFAKDMGWTSPSPARVE